MKNYVGAPQSDEEKQAVLDAQKEYTERYESSYVKYSYGSYLHDMYPESYNSPYDNED